MKLKSILLSAAACLLLTQSAVADDSCSYVYKPGQFCWNELATADVQAAKDFYGNVFGWKFIDHEMAQGGSYTMIEVDGKGIGGIWQIPVGMEDQIPSQWISYVLVEDIENSVKEAENSGAFILQPVVQLGDFGALAVIKDPTGALVALWQSLIKE